jgi:outer membrane protein TolC
MFNRKSHSKRGHQIPVTLAFTFLTLIFILGHSSYAQAVPASSSQPSAPFTLRQAVELALQNNPSLKAAHEGLAMAQQKVPQAVSRYLPEVNFDETFTRGNNPVYVFGSLLNQRQFGPQNFAISSLNKPDALDNFQAKLSVEQVLYDAGKIRGAISQAKLGEKVAQQDVEKTRQELIFRVVKAYTMHLLALSGEQVVEEAVKTAEASSVKAASMYQSGMIVESDRLAAQVFLARMQEELLKAKNEVALSKASLNFEMGVPVDNPIEIAAGLNEVRFDSESQESLFNQALERRPDYVQTVLLKNIAQKGVGIARAEFLPQIGVYGSWEADSQTFADRGGNNWIVGARLHFNLFRGRGDKAQLEEAKANLERSMALNNLVSAAVKLQVKQTVLDLDTTRQRIEVTKSAIGQAEETLRIVQNRYGAGLTTITELLRAQTDLTQTRTSYFQALYQHRIAKANAELASGILDVRSQVLNQ